MVESPEPINGQEVQPATIADAVDVARAVEFYNEVTGGDPELSVPVTLPPAVAVHFAPFVGELKITANLAVHNNSGLVSQETLAAFPDRESYALATIIFSKSESSKIIRPQPAEDTEASRVTVTYTPLLTLPDNDNQPVFSVRKTGEYMVTYQDVPFTRHILAALWHREQQQAPEGTGLLPFHRRYIPTRPTANPRWISYPGEDALEKWNTVSHAEAQDVTTVLRSTATSLAQIYKNTSGS